MTAIKLGSYSQAISYAALTNPGEARLACTGLICAAWARPLSKVESDIARERRALGLEASPVHQSATAPEVEPEKKPASPRREALQIALAARGYALQPKPAIDGSAVWLCAPSNPTRLTDRALGVWIGPRGVRTGRSWANAQPISPALRASLVVEGEALARHVPASAVAQFAPANADELGL